MWPIIEPILELLHFTPVAVGAAGAVAIYKTYPEESSATVHVRL
jgi:hypothetical protein